jgi:hypothetical protein
MFTGPWIESSSVCRIEQWVSSVSDNEGRFSLQNAVVYEGIFKEFSRDDR